MASEALIAAIVAGTGIGGTVAGALLAQRGDRKKDERALRRYWVEQRLTTYQDLLRVGRRWSDEGVHRMHLALGEGTDGVRQAQDEVTEYRAVLGRVRLLATPNVWTEAVELDKAWAERSVAYFNLLLGLPDLDAAVVTDETRDAVQQLQLAVARTEAKLERVSGRFAEAVQCELEI